MGDTIVTVLDRSIGPRLLLPTHLASQGHAVIVLSTPDEARRWIEAHAFDWLVLDEAAVRLDGAALRAHLARRAPRARVVWLGPLLPAWRLPIQARFDKPLDYTAIDRFFAGPMREDGR